MLRRVLTCCAARTQYGFPISAGEPVRYDFSTDSVPPPERLRAWQSIVQDACVPLGVRASDRALFEGALSSRDIDDLCVSLVQSVCHVGHHDREQVARTEGDFLLVSFQLGGKGVLEQGGRSALLSGSDMVIYDASRPFCWSFPAGFCQLVMRIPCSRLKFRLAMPNSYTAQRVVCSEGLGRVACDYLMSIFREAEAIDVATTRRLTDGALDLIAAAFTSQAGKPAGPRTNVQALHLNQAYTYIGEHIRDPELSPGGVAGALGISVRYLHHLFKSQGTSVNHYILRKRLSHCAQSLEPSSGADASISAIAFSWGFNSAVHFCRAFRAEFGMSAREYRALQIERRSSCRQ